MAVSVGEFCSFCTGRPPLRSARASSSRPVSIASSRRSRENHCLILLRARGEVAICSQSRDGPAEAVFEVTISTVSPECSLESRGSKRPFTRAPTQRWPTSVWMA